MNANEGGSRRSTVLVKCKSLIGWLFKVFCGSKCVSHSDVENPCGCREGAVSRIVGGSFTAAEASGGKIVLYKIKEPELFHLK